jgi:putative ABC transport system substrate-binding protein
MDRRKFAVTAGVALAAPLSLLAQPAGRVYRIALLDDAVESARRENWRLFRERLAQLGYVEGRNVSFELRRADGAAERLPALASELFALRPDVLVSTGTIASMAVRKANSSIPAVFIGVGDPVGAGIVASLARPGGSMTGTSVMTADVSGKLLELMREVVPGAKRLAYLADLTNKSSELALRRLQESAKQVGVSLQAFNGRTRDDLERAQQAIRREQFQGLIVGASGVVVGFREQIVQFAAVNKLPTIYARREYVDAGGLLSYGPSFQRNYVRTADYVHRILQGAKPADLPVEQPRGVEMVLNLKTARALGIKIPGSLRLRADEMIE